MTSSCVLISRHGHVLKFYQHLLLVQSPYQQILKLLCSLRSQFYRKRHLFRKTWHIMQTNLYDPAGLLQQTIFKLSSEFLGSKTLEFSLQISAYFHQTFLHQHCHRKTAKSFPLQRSQISTNNKEHVRRSAAFSQSSRPSCVRVEELRHSGTCPWQWPLS